MFANKSIDNPYYNHPVFDPIHGYFPVHYWRKYVYFVDSPSSYLFDLFKLIDQFQNRF